MTQAAGDPLISTIGLSKRYRGRLVVDQAEFTVQPGDVFGLLGPNGAGKTTIIRLLLGLIKPTAGRAVMFGRDVANDRQYVLRRTSAIVESPALYPHLTAWDNLRVMGLSAGVSDTSKMREALEQMGLSTRAKDKFRTFSLGMKQRLCIAAALLTDPQLIILDEPTNGLDPAGIHDIREMIKRLSEQGRTIFLSSHLLNEVQQVCNRVAIIQTGRIVAQGLVDELLAAGSYTQLKVQPGEMNRAAEVLRAQAWISGLRQQGEYLLVDGNLNQGAVLNQALSQAGIFASEIIPRSLSLEEYFLSVTGTTPPPPNGYGPGNGYSPQPGYGNGYPPPGQYPPPGGYYGPPPGQYPPAYGNNGYPPALPSYPMPPMPNPANPANPNPKEEPLG